MIDSDTSLTEEGRDNPAFVCEACDEAFASKEALERHVKAVGLVY